MEIYSEICSARPQGKIYFLLDLFLGGFIFKHFISILWWFCFGNIFGALHKSISNNFPLSDIAWKIIGRVINYPDVFRWLKTIVGITESSFSYVTCTTLTVTDTSTKMTLIASQSSLPSWRAEESGATKGEDFLGSYYKIADHNLFSFSRYSMIMSDFWDQIAEIADLNKVRRFQGYLFWLFILLSICFLSLGWGRYHRGVPRRLEECQPWEGVRWASIHLQAVDCCHVQHNWHWR